MDNIIKPYRLLYNPSKFSMDNAWTSKPTCANMTLEIPTSNKHIVRHDEKNNFAFT